MTKPSGKKADRMIPCDRFILINDTRTPIGAMVNLSDIISYLFILIILFALGTSLFTFYSTKETPRILHTKYLSISIKMQMAVVKSENK